MEGGQGSLWLFAALGTIWSFLHHSCLGLPSPRRVCVAPESVVIASDGDGLGTDKVIGYIRQILMGWGHKEPDSTSQDLHHTL